MRPLRQPRGFTLMELMVSVVVVAFSLSLVMGIFVAQQKSFQGLDLMRVAQEAGRDASLDFETSLRRAGFGFDPQYTFDFSRYACSPPTPCRDHADGPDEIVFYARNPNYRWIPTSCPSDNSGGCFTAGKGWSINATPSNTSVQLNFRANESLHLFPGQMLQLTKINGASPVLVVVQTELDIPKAGVASTPAIALDSTQQVGTPASGWTGYVAAFLVDRYRYFISTQNGAPYLMFDSGLRIGGAATTEQVPVAKNVEDMQIAYVMNASVGGSGATDASNANWIVADAPGVQEQPNPGITPPDYVNTAQTASARFSLSPANIRAVRYTFTIRSEWPDLSLFTPGATTGWQGDPFLYQENRNANAPALGGYRRLVIAGSVVVRNMETRNSFTY